jgi:hypothetical protein
LGDRKTEVDTARPSAMREASPNFSFPTGANFRAAIGLDGATRSTRPAYSRRPQNKISKKGDKKNKEK